METSGAAISRVSEFAPVLRAHECLEITSSGPFAIPFLSHRFAATFVPFTSPFSSPRFLPYRTLNLLPSLGSLLFRRFEPLSLSVPTLTAPETTKPTTTESMLWSMGEDSLCYKSRFAISYQLRYPDYRSRSFCLPTFFGPGSVSGPVEEGERERKRGGPFF